MSATRPRTIVESSKTYVYSAGTMSWVAMTQPSGGGGGDASAAKQDTGNTSLASIDAKNPALVSGRVPVDGSGVTQPVSIATMPSTPVTGTFYPATQPVSIAAPVAVTGSFYQATQPISAVSLPLPTSASTESTLGTRLSESDFDTKAGGLTETAPATDTASSGLNGRLQRIAQRLTSLIALLPTALGVGGGLRVDGSGTALPVSGTVAVTNANLDAAMSTLATQATLALIKAKTDNLDVAASTLATAARQDTGNTSLGSVKTNTDPLVAPAAGGYVRQDSTGTLAKETGGNLDNIATQIARLPLAQGIVNTGLYGPLVQAVVSDSPQSYSTDVVQPLSVTTEGRLRVSTVIADNTQVWQDEDVDYFDNDDTTWKMESLYV